MGHLSQPYRPLPSSQQSIRDKCFHPSGTFIEFKKEDIEGSIPNRFEQQATRYPDRLAVKTKTHQLTYDELNKAANRVARAILEQRGAGEEPIALRLENDAPMMAAILGVLKSGKIYVPLDPSYPQPRTSHMLKDSQAGLIITNNKNLPWAHQWVQNERQLLNIDELDSSFSTENPSSSISPNTD